MITSQNLLHPDKQTLWGDYGFKNKNNNVGAWFSRLVQAAGERASLGSGLQSELEGDRQGAVRGLVANSNPANMVANAKSNANSLVSGGAEHGQQLAQLLRMMGGGEGAQLGAVAQGQNDGTEAANKLLLNAHSPEAQNAALMQMLQAIQQAGGSGLEELLAMSGVVSQKEHDRMARKQGQGMGGLTSILGTVLGGGINLGNLFRPGGVTGSGSNASLDYGVTPVPY